jgi:transketolase
MPSNDSVPNGASHHENTDVVLTTIRALAADLTLQFKGGHSGTAMGAAALGV